MGSTVNTNHNDLPIVPQAGQQSMAPPQTPSTAGALPTSPIEMALTTLMSANLSPYQKASQFAHIKEDYLAKTYGVTIE